MKLPFHTIIPLILASCGELTPKDQDIPFLPPPAITSARATAPAPAPAQAPAPAPAPRPISSSTTPGPGNPLGFLDPNTTDELMTDAKKKTVTLTNTDLPPTPKIEGDSAIDIDPPKLPALDLPKKER